MSAEAVPASKPLPVRLLRGLVERETAFLIVILLAMVVFFTLVTPSGTFLSTTNATNIAQVVISGTKRVGTDGAISKNCAPRTRTPRTTRACSRTSTTPPRCSCRCTRAFLEKISRSTSATRASTDSARR